MKVALAAFLSLTSALGLFVGKYGSIVSLLVWILGLLGVITYVSFWWVTLFVGIFITSLVLLPVVIQLLK
jgi:hypothetical protein